DELLVSVAGVAMNLVIAVVFALIARMLIVVLGYEFLSGSFGYVLWMVVIDVIIINLALMIFNLIPCPPLDGFSIISEIFNIKHTDFYWTLYRYGNWILVGLIVFNITGMILSPCLNFLYNLLSTWIIF
ncbi:MAG: site-2 protease family protein, partial [Anaerovoracaceae bacterium]